MVVILQNIRSMHNVGSIFRTADAAGCRKIFLCGITPGPKDRFGKINLKFSKVSLGAENYVSWERVGSTTRLLDKFKKAGYKIIALEQNKKAVSLFSEKSGSARTSKRAIVLGAEIKGLSDAVLKRADKIIAIPMRGKKESLNVAVAFGIAIFHLSR